jgi:endonuclease/exonuclease/phosphatase family metal-dependent hydrolase
MQENRSFDHCFGTLKGVRGFNDPRAIRLPDKNLVWMQTNEAGETYSPFRFDIRNTKATWMGSTPHSRGSQVDAWNDGKLAGEFSEIFYKKDKFQMLAHGDFWLSETPEKPGLGWDATCCNRICSWVYLQDKKSKKKFYVFNTHYDYQKNLARNESSKLILKKIKSIAGSQPVIFMGDMNGGNESSWYKEVANSGILKDTYKEAKNPYAVNGSFNAFGHAVKSDEIIDHIFITKQFTVEKWGILTDTYHGKYPSDHFPVLAVLKM